MWRMLFGTADLLAKRLLAGELAGQDKRLLVRAWPANRRVAMEWHAGSTPQDR